MNASPKIPSSSAPKLPLRGSSTEHDNTKEQLEAMNSHGARIQELLQQIETVPTPSTRELIHEFMEATLAFYGQGLSRILQLVSQSDSDGQATYQHLLNDKVVRGLLLIHDLH